MPAMVRVHGDGLELQAVNVEPQLQQQQVQLQHDSLFQPSVQHIPQQYSWDCGLACVLMVLQALGCSCTFSQLRRLSQTTSIWTVDLAHLLAHFGASVTFSTITIGINSDYANEWFYMEHLEHDEQRVQRLFRQADKLGITLQQRSIPLEDLATALLSGRQLAILLVDKRKIDPWQAAADMAWNYTTGVTSATCYTGHYILLTGYEPPAAQASGAAPTAPLKTMGGAVALAARQQQRCSCSCEGGSSRCSCSSACSCSLDRPLTAAELQQDRQQQAVQCSPAAEPPATAATDAAMQCYSSTNLGRQGFFWVHDPARASGPIRVPVSIVESARKTFGTDEDLLLIDMAEPIGTKRAAAAARTACDRVTAAEPEKAQFSAATAASGASSVSAAAAAAVAPGESPCSCSGWLHLLPWLGTQQQQQQHKEHKEQTGQQQCGREQLQQHTLQHKQLQQEQQQQLQDKSCALHCSIANYEAGPSCVAGGACVYNSGGSCCSSCSSCISSREQGMITD